MKNRPSHRISLIIERPKRDAEFLEIGAAWATEKGSGLSFELNVDLRRGDRLYLETIDWDARDAKKQNAPTSEHPQ